MFTNVRETLAALFARLQALTSGFLANARGNVAVITALSAIPIISAVGCVVDYSMATMIKTKLQAAADAATLAAVSSNSPVVATAKAMTTNGTVAGGQTYTQNFFDSNLSGAPASSGYTSASRLASVSKTGSKITASISFSAQVPTFFLGILGYPNVSLAGQSTSSYTLPNYIDFYLMLDVSGSMGMPSTSAEQVRLQSVNPDNLNGSLCYATVNSSSSCSVGLTTSLTGSTITTFATQLANLLDTGQNTTLGSGGTHFENALNTMNTNVLPSTAGTGTASSPLPYLFIITDGSQDYQTQSGGNWGSQNWHSTAAVPYQNSATVIPPNSVTTTDYCTTMKNRGITIAVLYIPYQTIQNANANFANNEDGYANNNIANISAALQNCASTNFFYTANTPADIQSALITMFQQAVSTAHVSN
jgi:Flp pilus assembly protein TadG